MSIRSSVLFSVTWYNLYYSWYNALSKRSHNWTMIAFGDIHWHIILFLCIAMYTWNEIPVNKSSRISAINRITNFSCVNPSRRNIRTHGIWIYDALLNQGFVIVLFQQTDILDYISSDGKHYDNYVSNYAIEFIITKSTFTVYNIVR